MAAALVFGLGAGVAQAADSYLIQLDDASVEGQITGNTYKNGTLIQSVVFAGEHLFSSYSLWSGATLGTSFDNQFNYYDLDGVTLSDTVHVYGTAGDGFFWIDFRSDPELAGPLPDGGHFIEDGSFQPAVYPGTVSNGDYYNLQIASDVGDVPEPAAWALMLIGFGGMGTMLRARRKGVTVTA
jgi:hypothetical protein